MSALEHSLALEVDGVTTRLGRFRLGPCSHLLQPGQVTVLLGGNGAGKSTFLHTVTGLIRRTGGTVQIGEADNFGNERAFKGSVGFAAQNPSFYGAMRLCDLVRFASAFWPDWQDDACDDLVARLRLSAHQRVGEMSTGTLKKVAIVLALSHAPDFVLLDEPTAGLDPASRRDVLSLLKETAACNRGVMFSTHVVGEVERMADWLLVIDHGNVIEEGSVASFQERLRTSQSLEDYMVELTKGELT